MFHLKYPVVDIRCSLYFTSIHKFIIKTIDNIHNASLPEWMRLICWKTSLHSIGLAQGHLQLSMILCSCVYIFDGNIVVDDMLLNCSDMPHFYIVL